MKTFFSPPSQNIWGLLFLAVTSFSVPVVVAMLSCRGSAPEVEDVSPPKNKKKRRGKIILNKNKKTKEQGNSAKESCSLDDPSSSCSKRRQGFQRKRTYSIEESSYENGTVYLPENNNLGSLATLGLQQPFVIAMVGLPARGKSYIVKMISRYLRWTGFESEVFNVGSYRRKMGLKSMNSSFFSEDNKDGKQKREELAQLVQDEMYQWLFKTRTSKCRVAIFDATNTTKSRRQQLCDRAQKEKVGLLFVESICDDEEILQANYLCKLDNDDYRCMDKTAAIKDFMKRVKAYEEVYHTVEDDENSGQISYIKLINVGQKVISRHCSGYVPSQVAFYLQNVHISPRTIYLTLPAENSDSVLSILGGDNPRMTPNGRQYSQDLSRYLALQKPHQEHELVVLTGTARVHAETAMHLRLMYPTYSSPLLNELRGGAFHGMQRDDIKTNYKDIFEKRQADKLNFRYPGEGGESYQDVIERVRPIIIELERQRNNVVVVCHLAVMRCIYGYFTGTPLEDIPHLSFEQHVLYTLQPGAAGCKTTLVNISEDLLPP